MYRLKPNSPVITAVDGPLTGRTFRHGEAYGRIPEGDENKFELILEEERPEEKKWGKKK